MYQGAGGGGLGCASSGSKTFNFLAKPFGGAQKTDFGYYAEGLRRGYEQALVTPENMSYFVIEKSDIVVLSNIRAFPRDRVLKMPNKYVMFHHDTWCYWRLYYPRTEKCLTSCPEYPFWREVVSKAKLNIFLSPLHYQIHKERFGDDIEPHAIVPSAINPDQFYDLGRPRREYGNLSGLFPFKGRNQLLKFAQEHPEIHLTVGGGNDEGGRRLDENLPENLTYWDKTILDGELNEWYNQFEYYIELPDTPQPFNRTVAEAYLAGCKIIGNKLLGALTWEWFTDRDSVRKNLRKAPGQFWDAITQVLELPKVLA